MARRFFRTVPLAPIAAGALLLATGTTALTSIWAPRTLALTHLGTLGLLSMGAMGTLYRLAPGVAGRPVPAPRIAAAVHALLCAGLVGLVAGLLGGHVRAAFASLILLALAVLLFVPHAFAALRGGRAGPGVVAGLRLALASLLVVAFLGLWMAHGHAGMRFPGPRALWIQVHLSVGFLGWVGALLAAAAWSRTPPDRPAQAWGALGCGGLVATAAPLVLLLDGFDLLPAGPLAPGDLAAAAAAPAAAAFWLLQPARGLRGPAAERLARGDPGLQWMGRAAAPATAAAALAALAGTDPRWGLLFGWLAIWGWGGSIVHGLLGRFQPGAATTSGMVLHGAALALGAAAIATGSDALARTTGAALLATGLRLATAQWRPAAAAAP